MPTIVAGIDIDRAYSGDEILDIHRSGRLRDVTLQGYCTRVDVDANIRFVPFYESTWFRSDQDTMVVAEQDIAGPMMADVNANHPIVRRTPQERVASLFLRLMTEYQRSGTLPGISSELITQVMQGSWREGEPLTAEVIRAVAAHYLGVGEVDNKKAKGIAIKDRTPEVAK